MKTITCHYNDNEIQFSVDPNDKNLMINATEMAKVFDRRIDFFLKTDHAKAFIEVLEFTPFGGNSEPLTKEEIIKTSHKTGTWMHRTLALKFAAWLDPKFEVWVYSRIDEIIFGYYKKHWDAHAAQEKAKIRMENIKQKILTEPTIKLVKQYFDVEAEIREARKQKTAAIKNQLRMFEQEAEDYE